MSISVIDPVSKAIDETKRSLFQPFNLSKWFAIGLCAWLTSFIEFSLNLNSRYNFGSNPGANRPLGGGFPKAQPAPANPRADRGEAGQLNGPAGDDAGEDNDAVVVGEDQGEDDFLRQILDWVRSHIPLFIGLAIAAAFLIFAVTLVFWWLGCRGIFMLIDNICKNKYEIGDPWREYAGEANSLFWFKFCFWTALFLVELVVLGLGVAIAWTDITQQNFGPAATTAIVVAVAIIAPMSIVALVVQFYLHALVVPIMYIKRLTTMEAWGVFRSTIMPGHIGSLILFLFLSIVFGIGIGITRIFAVCATCCVAAIPYLGTVMTLPLPYFQRCYTLAFLEQFGPEFRVLGGHAKPASPFGGDPDFIG